MRNVLRRQGMDEHRLLCHEHAVALVWRQAQESDGLRAEAGEDKAESVMTGEESLWSGSVGVVCGGCV